MINIKNNIKIQYILNFILFFFLLGSTYNLIKLYNIEYISLDYLFVHSMPFTLIICFSLLSISYLNKN